MCGSDLNLPFPPSYGAEEDRSARSRTGHTRCGGRTKHRSTHNAGHSADGLVRGVDFAGGILVGLPSFGTSRPACSRGGTSSWDSGWGCAADESFCAWPGEGP